MNEIRLEFVRNGPPHNQLLSPLTQYLAICGDHPVAAVTLPFEHRDLMTRLRRLGAAGGGEPERAAAAEEIRSLSAEMGRILAQIPGLIAEFHGEGGTEGLAHLRLVLSANELALLPFEIAAGSAGLPGAGQHLSLQSSLPVCITREIRRAKEEAFRWPSDCRVLFVTTAPSGLPMNLCEAHVQALRIAIDPWVHHVPRSRNGTPESMVSDHLEVLLDATTTSLAEKMATGDFTHVHILAHGAQLPGVDERRFGVVFRDGVVDGDRLALLLRMRKKPQVEGLGLPAVVTLAVCDGGNIGDVVSSGASLAHEIHRAGVPLVVASQFPLSFLGSVHLASLLYGPLLEGRHPLHALDDVRRRLKALVPDHHDWAGLVVYAGLPDDLESQLLAVRLARGRRRIEGAMSHLDALSSALSPTYRQLGVAKVNLSLTERLEIAEKRFDGACEALLELEADAPALRAPVFGLLASAEKRMADVLWRYVHRLEDDVVDGDDSVPAMLRRRSRDYLRRSAEHYAKTFECERDGHWALVQAMALRIADGASPPKADWELARLLSDRDKIHADSARVVWALNNLVELAVIGLRVTPPFLKPEAARDMGDKAIDRLLELLPLSDPAVHSLRRQLLRYAEGFLRMAETPADELARAFFGRIANK